MTRWIGSFLKYFFVILIVLINLFPFFSIALNSFRNYEEILSKPIGFGPLSLKNYVKAEQTAHLLRALLNGIVISFASILLIIPTSTMLSYAVTKMNFKINKIVYGYIAVGYLVPAASILINMYLVLKFLHLLNTYWGIILAYGAIYISIAVITISGFMKSIPNELIESAKIDGANHFRILWRVVFPLCQPIVATMVILLFLWTFREFIWPQILLKGTIAQRPIAVALASFVGERFIDYGQMSAAVVISVVPIMIVFIFMKDKIISGLSAGALKA
jgi:raffinose/stachyose/melibiose transport system permease protein